MYVTSDFGVQIAYITQNFTRLLAINKQQKKMDSSQQIKQITIHLRRVLKKTIYNK